MKVELAKAVYQLSPGTSKQTVEQAVARSAQEVNRVESARLKTDNASTKVEDAYLSVRNKRSSLHSATYQYRVQETRKATEQISGAVASTQRDIVKVLSTIISPNVAPENLGRFIDRFS
ncbi:MAG TPA: hypothetical protein PKO06_21895 [Candidatus Ozemobacteraceae bacterium]|nr:hypothetical protein [Candidatus Ozemobacteraceae bacterium]